MSDINISGVSKSFGPVRALQDIALQIPHGTILALLGPSGCGKTTLLRLLAGFDTPDAGEIRFGAELVASSARVIPPERRGIGYVPQEGTLFPHLTVAGNVRFGLPRGSDRDQRIREVLELTSMGEFADRYPHELSGGQQQRVALARALAPRPRLVLLDEPFNALDLDLRRSMCAEVTDLLRKAGTTTILVTHDPSEAFAAADEIAVMRAGHIMQCARPETVYWHPTNPEVARLTGATIMLDGHFEQGSVAACCLGRLSLPGGSAVPATGRATVMVRPEQVRWADSGEGVPARIVRRAFHGDHTHLGVELPGTCLDLTMPSLEAPDMDAQGVVRILGTCMAYPAEPGAAQSVEVTPSEPATVLRGLAAA